MDDDGQLAGNGYPDCVSRGVGIYSADPFGVLGGHDHEPGCAVQAAVAVGGLDPERLERWRKLGDENRINTPVQSGPRGSKQTKSSVKRR
ncbi:hypothetical protein [Gemmobacter aquaticus]|uniref:hypothetical protein n=1 Tax=Gemmobacter aquaticus TaxID=490185 RepID=UPI0019D5D22C